jgi:hypothetical protein
MSGLTIQLAVKRQDFQTPMTTALAGEAPLCAPTFALQPTP